MFQPSDSKLRNESFGIDDEHTLVTMMKESGSLLSNDVRRLVYAKPIGNVITSNSTSCVSDEVEDKPNTPIDVPALEARLALLTNSLQTLAADLRKARALNQNNDSPSEEDEFDAAARRCQVTFKVVRVVIMLALVGITGMVMVNLTTAWWTDGRFSTTSFSMEEVTALGLPTSGMIPAPYATDSRCFYPTPLNCTAYFGEATLNQRQQFNCMKWMHNISGADRVSGDGTVHKMVIWTVDGALAAGDGFYFSSILDYVQLSFSFPLTCTQPYLWVYVSGDTAMGTLDPQASMRSYAQASFLIQGGQYVMAAFTISQDVSLNGDVANTSSLSVSSMMTSNFDPAQRYTATAVYRPASFKIPTTTEVPGQSLLDFIANAGGWIGLFLGFSFMNVVDAVERIHSSWAKKRAKEIMLARNAAAHEMVT